MVTWQELESSSCMLMQEMTYTSEPLHHGMTVTLEKVYQEDRPLQAGNCRKKLHKQNKKDEHDLVNGLLKVSLYTYA